MFQLQRSPTPSNNIPLEKHLRQVARSRGVDEDEFLRSQLPEGTPVEPPEHMLWWWGAFCCLDRRRHEGAPLSFQEIAAFAQLLRVNLDPWEVDLLLAIDDERVKALHGSRSAPNPNPQ